MSALGQSMRASPAITGGNPIMATDSHSFTPETARQFDRYSVANAVTVKQTLPCGCEPYEDVFTYRRWKAQGMQVQKGQKAIKLPLVIRGTRKDDESGEERAFNLLASSAVFCRCQVKAQEGGQS